MTEHHYSDEDYRRAKKKVKAKKGFYSHLASYVIVISFLFALNFITDPGEWWFMFPMLGWGLGILFHYIGVFGIPGLNFNDKAWEEKEIEKELYKNAPNKQAPTVPEDELELKEFKKLRDEWEDSDFV